MSETTQPAPETDEKKSRGLGSYVLWAFVAVMVYVLSSGPAELLLTTRSESRSRNWRLAPSPRTLTLQIPPFDNALRWTYKPIFWAYGRAPLHKPLGLYFHLWCPASFDKRGNPIIHLYTLEIGTSLKLEV